MPKPMELSVKNDAVNHIDSKLGCQDAGLHVSRAMAKKNGNVTVMVFDRCLA